MTKYFARPNTWFDEGTEVKLINNYDDPEGNLWEGCGLYEGLKDGKLDQEVCPHDEFQIKEE